MSARDPRRRFTDFQVRQLLIACNGKCERCGSPISGQSFHAHHKKRHADGGRTELYNGQLLCVRCHKEVS